MVNIFRRARPGSDSSGPDSPPPDDPDLRAVLQATTAATRRPFLRRLEELVRRSDVTEELWDDLEEALIAADVGLATTTQLVAGVRTRAEAQGSPSAQGVRDLLRLEMTALLRQPQARGALWGAADLPPFPHVIVVVGVNGAGKTTTMAKLAHAYLQEDRSVILGAADTFRAAGIEQVRHWADRLGVSVVAGEAGSDPGAVAFDTLGALKARNVDVAIIDTAGRLETKKNLMAELGKIRRVVAGRLPGAPHEVLLVLDATTGQNGLEQARVFCEATDVTSICLAKLDGAAKGGVALAIAQELDVPVQLVGTGSDPADLAPFDAEAFVSALFTAGEDAT